jgi:hypothetical protein
VPQFRSKKEQFRHLGPLPIEIYLSGPSTYTYECPEFGPTGWGRKGPEFLWKTLVEEHSQIIKSFTSDRLPALAGIANELEQAWGDKYLVDLWQKTFTKQASWTRHAETDLPDPPSERAYHAPSWSWLSIPEGTQIDMPGGVPNFGTNKFELYATLKSYFIKPKYPSLSRLGEI